MQKDEISTYPGRRNQYFPRKLSGEYYIGYHKCRFDVVGTLLQTIGVILLSEMAPIV